MRICQKKVLAPDCYIKSMLVLDSNCLKHNTLYTDITVATCFIPQIFLYTSYAGSAKKMYTHFNERKLYVV